MPGITNDPINKAFQPFGSGILEVWDAATSTWVRFGAVRNWTPSTNQETRMQDFPVGGEYRNYQNRTVRRGLSFGCTLVEQGNPDAMHLLIGTPGQALTLTAKTVTSDSIQMPLYGTDLQFLTNTHGLPVTNTDYLPVPTIHSIAAAGSAGSGWSGSAMYFWILPLWGDPTDLVAGTANLFANNVDVDFVVGPPSASATVTPTTNQSVTIEIDAYTGPAPDYYICVVAPSNSITAGFLQPDTAATGTPAELYLLTDGAADVFTIDDYSATNATYAAPVGIGVQSITNYDYNAGTATLTKLTSGTDYTYNATNGTIARVDGGAIVDGQRVKITSWYVAPAKLTESYGASGSVHLSTVKMRCTRIDEELDPVTGQPALGEGEVWTVYRANMRASNPQFSYTEQDFADGASITVECLYDETQNKIASVDLWSQKHRNYVTTHF